MDTDFVTIYNDNHQRSHQGSWRGRRQGLYVPLKEIPGGLPGGFILVVMWYGSIATDGQVFICILMEKIREYLWICNGAAFLGQRRYNNQKTGR